MAIICSCFATYRLASARSALEDVPAKLRARVFDVHALYRAEMNQAPITDATPQLIRDLLPETMTAWARPCGLNRA